MWVFTCLFLLQVWSPPSEYHYNCNSSLQLTAADFLSIKASKRSKCGSFLAGGNPLYSLISWLLSMKVISRLEPQSTIFFFWHFRSELTNPSFVVYDCFRLRMQPPWKLLTSFPKLSFLEVSPKVLQLPSSKVRNLPHFLYRKQNNGPKDDHKLHLGTCV